jgi:hypothetical protein
VEQRFNIGSIVERYQELYRQIAAAPRATAAQSSNVTSAAA